SYWGNPIAEYRHRDINWDDKGSQDAYKDFYTNDKNFYKHDTVKTFVWLPIKEIDKDYKLKPLTLKDIDNLMRDIIGEAG
ncbi:MAG: hypothetical protein K5649_04515, partial [Lachnospiraceae bacterium]|nr:hypothetical protein [Lachnospiraceae bacterium]